jgi:hypothetical protein
MRKYRTVKIGKEHTEKRTTILRRYPDCMVDPNFKYCLFPGMRSTYPTIKLLFFLLSNMHVHCCIKHYLSLIFDYKNTVSLAITYYMLTVSSTIGYIYPPFRLLNNHIRYRNIFVIIWALLGAIQSSQL